MHDSGFASGTAWVDLETTLYRYYTAASSGSIGFVSGLKYVVGPEAYRRLSADPNVSDPLLAPDSIVAQYADNYFEYDSDRRVTKSVVAAGLRTYLVATTLSGNTDDYNNWFRKTTTTRPDGSVEIVYTNHLGQMMLRDFSDGGSNHWYDYYLYDGNGHEIQHALPSAVVTYNDASPDLGVTLNSSTGLIRATTYYSGTPGQPDGYVEYEQVQEGSGGSPIPVRLHAYGTHSDVHGVTIHPVSALTVYQTDFGGGSPVTTNYSYTFFTNLNQPEFRTIALPAVLSPDQNGSGSSNSRQEMYDTYGNLVAAQDERLYITTYAFDVVLGVMTRMVQDDTAPSGSGWTENGGMRLKLTTDYEHDDLARTTQVLGPIHQVNGQAVRTASWSVFDDVDHEIRSAQGYATGIDSGPEYSFTLVNPVSIMRMDEAGRTVDSIQAVRQAAQPAGIVGPAPDCAPVESPGRLTAGDTFPQCTWVRWSSSQFDNHGLMTSSRVYYCIPSCGIGQPGVNYNETDFGYDVAHGTAEPGPSGGWDRHAHGLRCPGPHNRGLGRNERRLRHRFHAGRRRRKSGGQQHGADHGQYLRQRQRGRRRQSDHPYRLCRREHNPGHQFPI